jgi:hypothetical protein
VTAVNEKREEMLHRFEAEASLGLMLVKPPPFAVVGLVDMLIITGAALLIFHVPFPPQLSSADILRNPVSDDQSGCGPVSLDHPGNTKAGGDDVVLLHHAGVHAERLRVSDRNMPLVVHYLTHLNPRAISWRSSAACF